MIVQARTPGYNIASEVIESGVVADTTQKKGEEVKRKNRRYQQKQNLVTKISRLPEVVLLATLQ